MGLGVVQEDGVDREVEEGEEEEEVVVVLGVGGEVAAGFKLPACPGAWKLFLRPRNMKPFAGPGGCAGIQQAGQIAFFVPLQYRNMVMR